MEVDDGRAVFEKLFGKPDEPVPVVDFADMKAMKAVMDDVKKRHPEGGVAIGDCIYKSVCSPEADVRAVWYRLSRLEMLAHFLKVAYPGGQWSDAAFKAAAKMELRWQFGVPENDFPFNVTHFLVQAMGEMA